MDEKRSAEIILSHQKKSLIKCYEDLIDPILARSILNEMNDWTNYKDMPEKILNMMQNEGKNNKYQNL